MGFGRTDLAERNASALAPDFWRNDLGVHLSSAAIENPNLRDFLYIATAAVGAVGAAAVAWPLIDQMNPDA